MLSPSVFINLRDVLADLYADEASARRITTNARLDGRRIQFSSRALDNWQAILTEATNVGRIDALVDAVLAEYGANPALTDAVSHYRAEPPEAGESPFKGLQYFDVSDAHLFFGREALTAELVTLLRHQRFLAVVGASGSGKSSVVRAGVVPALRRTIPLADGALPPQGSDRWLVHIITPTTHPLETLALDLLLPGETEDDIARFKKALQQTSDSLHLRSRRLLTATGAPHLLLIVDQFEELFTLCKAKEERKAFVDNLLSAATDDRVTTVVITLRADFYAQCAEFANLRQALESQQKYIGPMKREELQRAIEEPARRNGWVFEPGLVDLILDDVGNEPGALPLLSHALLETWKRRRGRVLTLEGYTTAGRVQSAIAQTADRVYRDQLTDDEKAIARNIFLSLTELGEESEDTRRRVVLGDLLAQSANPPAVEKVLKTLVDARLITTDEDLSLSDRQQSQAHIEVAHEALIRAWPQLRRWLDENREGLRIHRSLNEAARTWGKLKPDSGALYSGVRLQQALNWQQECDVALTPMEAAFLKASKRRRDLSWCIYAMIGVAVVIAMVWLIRGQVNEFRFGRTLQAISPLILAGDATGAIGKLQAAHVIRPDKFDLDTATKDVKRRVATMLVEDGEKLAKEGDYTGAEGKFKAALILDPPPDTPVYVWIPAGEFIMGTTQEQIDTIFKHLYPQTQIYEGDFKEETPTHTVSIDGFWIMRTKVTNAQYKRCVKEKVCEPPSFNRHWDKEQFAKQPVTGLDWDQVTTYAEWVGGRLPTEAEWEKACRGGLEIPVDPLKGWDVQQKNPYPQRIFPWGDDVPTEELSNFNNNMGSVTDVGSYPRGGSPYGALDMAGNVEEWTADLFDPEYYAHSPAHNPKGSESVIKAAYGSTIRGGSFNFNDAGSVRCAARISSGDSFSVDNGFRVVSLGFAAPSQPVSVTPMVATPTIVSPLAEPVSR